MTTKEYLLQIKEQGKNILNQEEYIQRLRDSLGVAGIRYDKERVQSSPEPDKFARIFGQIFEEEEKLQQMKDDLALKRVEIINQIHRLKTCKHQNVLYIVYVDRKELEKSCTGNVFFYEYVKNTYCSFAGIEEKFPPQSA